MKKLSRVLLAAFLAATLVFSLVACGGGGSPKGEWTISKINGIDIQKYFEDNVGDLEGEDKESAVSLAMSIFSAYTITIDDKNITTSIMGQTEEKPYTLDGNNLKMEDGTVFVYDSGSDTITCSGDSVGDDTLQNITLKRK